MAIYNPYHPGEFIREIYMEQFGITGRQTVNFKFILITHPQ